MQETALIPIALGVIYLAGRTMFGKAYTPRRFFTDLAFICIVCVFGFFAAIALLAVLP